MALRYFTALVGGALTVLGVGIWPARVEAKPYPVRIESQPSGATIYLDSKERNPLGQTPYIGKLAPGAHILILELEGYVSEVQDIVVRRKRKIQRIAVKLSKIELANLEIEFTSEKNSSIGRSDLKGARIRIDGKDVGNPLDAIRVPAGPHQVEVVADGYLTFETWVEATGGNNLHVAAKLVPIAATGKAVAGADPATDRRAETGAEEDPDAPHGASHERVAAGEAGAEKSAGSGGSVDQATGKHGAARSVSFIAVGAGFELGGRRFRPNAQEVQGLREFDAEAVPMVRLLAEVNPLAFSPSRWLSGWGLYATYARATPFDSTARLMDGSQIDVPTEWSELDFGLRYRYAFGPASFIGGQVGYGNHTFAFDFANRSEELRDQVPDVDYAYWRFGGEGRVGFGRFAALASGGTRLVNSIGNLGDRFAQTDILAFDAELGAAATLTRSIEARLIGRYERYAHEYTAMPSGPGAAATSGLDQFFGVTLSAVFMY